MAGKTIAITRPRAEKDALTGLLQDRGYHVIHEPLTHIVLRIDAQEKIEQAIQAHPDAVVVTSRQGVRALATFTGLRDMALLCVGPATAHAAEASGFTRVYAAGGNVQRLIEYILASYDPDSRFLYVSAEHVRSDIASLLSRQGMSIERVVVYDAMPAEHFSDTFAEHLKRGQIDAVTFLSQRSAEVFVNLAAEAKLLLALRNLHACCMSKPIAKTLTEKQWRRVHVTRAPTLASLAECIDTVFAKRKKA